MCIVCHSIIRGLGLGSQTKGGCLHRGGRLLRNYGGTKYIMLYVVLNTTIDIMLYEALSIAIDIMLYVVLNTTIDIMLYVALSIAIDIMLYVVLNTTIDIML